MRRSKLALLASLIAVPMFAQQPASLTGTWLLTTDYYGAPIFWPLHLTDTQGKLTGDLDGDPLQGTLSSGHIRFLAKDPKGGFEDVTATLSGTTFTGTVNLLGENEPASAAELHTFTATLQPAPRTGTPQHLEFTPTRFYNQFSFTIPPVLRLFPGDSLHTTTVDAAGFDEHHVHRARGGNPQTGPFYIESAMPGDTLVIHINRLRLNRDTAISNDNLVPRAMTSDLAVQTKDTGADVTWHLDLAHNVATSSLPGEHLRQYTVPLRPMLGCIATAPQPGPAVATNDSGRFGGNMDFNEVVEGNTVYLHVSVPGALLFFGDGHAAQGDGELNGNALETSLDVDLTIDILHGSQLASPRIESPDDLMSMGLEGSLDEAFKSATDSMFYWLKSTYHLAPSEIDQVLGTSAQYIVSEAADRNAGIVLKIPKSRLATIQTTPPSPAK